MQSLSQHSEHLAVSSIRWLGIHPTDIEALSIPSIPLTPRDITKLLDLAGRPYMQQDPNLMEQVGLYYAFLCLCYFNTDVLTTYQQDINVKHTRP